MITPKEAFEAIKVLWPKTTAIARSELDDVLLVISPSEPYKQSFGVGVAWGTTVTYPVPAKKWRDARPEDLGYPFREVRFRDQSRDWTVGLLAGYFPDAAYPWVSKTGTGWIYCQIEDK